MNDYVEVEHGFECLTPDAFAADFISIAQSIASETEYIRSLDRDTVKNLAFNMLRFAVLCTKHPGFHEEREWRVVASPAMHPSARTSESHHHRTM
jgi:hypothetical protein